MTEGTPEASPAETALGVHQEARAALRSDRAAEAEELCRRAIAILEPIEVERRRLSHVMVTLSQALEKLDRLPEALGVVDRACQLVRDEPTELVKALNERALFLLRSGHASAAMATLRAALSSPGAAGLEPDWLGVMHDHLGWALSESGDVEGALKAHAEAAELLADSEPYDRIISLLAAARAAQSGDLDEVAVDYFRSALSVARAAVQLDPDEQDRYRDGCARAVAGRFADRELEALFHMAAWTAAVGGMGPGSPWEMFAEVRQRAADGGDPWVAMLAHIKLIELWGRDGDLPSAARACRAGLDWARGEGLAPFAGWFASELAHLRRISGLAENEDAGLFLLVEAEHFFAIHELHLVQLGMDPATTLGEQSGVQFNPGVTLSALGAVARDFGDAETALALFTDAIRIQQELAIPQAWGHTLAQCNHLLALTDLRNRRPQDADVQQEIETDIAVLEELLAPGDLTPGDEVAARTALHGAKPWPSIEDEIAELRRIADLDYRPAAVSPNDRRPSITVTLSRRLTESGRHAAAWEALQRVRARSLLDARTAFHTGDEYQPPTAAEAGELLVRTRLSGREPSVLVDVVTLPDGLGAYLVDAEGRVDFVDSRGDLSPLAAASRGDEGAQAAGFLALAREDDVFGTLATRIHERAGGADVLLSVDDRLANLPWASVSVNGAPWWHTQPIARIPAVAVLRFRARQLSGSSLVVGDSAGDLPDARRECRAVADLLDAGPPLLCGGCTADAVGAGRGHDPLDFLHVAVHGYADSRRGGRATLLFAKPDGGTAWVPFEALADLPWQARVVVLSGCSTAVGGPRNGEGLYGIAHTAMTHGADTVIATLWPVNDGAAAAFMTAFYADVTEQLTAGEADLRLALRAAAHNYRRPANTRTRHVRDAGDLVVDPGGQNPPPALPHQLAVSDAFVIIGDPVLRR